MVRRYKRSYKRKRGIRRSVYGRKSKSTITRRNAFAPNHYTSFGGFPRFFMSLYPPSQCTIETFGDIERHPISGLGGIGGSQSTNWYRLASLYDPYGPASAGVNTEWWSQLVANYAQYVVYKVDVSVRVYDAENGSVKLYVTVQSSQDTTAIAGMDPAWYERNRTCKVITPYSSGGTAGPNNQEENFSFNICDIEGLTKSQYIGNNQYHSAINGNPARSPFMYLTCADPGGNASVGCRVQVRLAIHVKLFQRKIAP